jgi:hypothetical protein
LPTVPGRFVIWVSYHSLLIKIQKVFNCEQSQIWTVLKLNRKKEKKRKPDYQKSPKDWNRKWAGPAVFLFRWRQAWSAQRDIIGAPGKTYTPTRSVATGHRTPPGRVWARPICVCLACSSSFFLFFFLFWFLFLFVFSIFCFRFCLYFFRFKNFNF